MGKLKKISVKSLLLYTVPPLVILLATIITITAAMLFYADSMDVIFGRGERVVVPSENTADWDTEYYHKQFSAALGEEGSRANGARVTKQIADEGIVLMKNDGVLPLTRGESVTPFGYRYIHPIYGGTGSGNTDVSEDYGWSAADCLKKYFKVNLDAEHRLMDSVPVQLTATSADKAFFEEDGDTEFAEASNSIYEFESSVYSGIEQTFENTVGVVFIGRIGGEGSNIPHEPFYMNRAPHALALSDYEKEAIAVAKRFCKAVVVVLNTSNTMEIAPLMEGEYEADAIIWIGGPGSMGFDSLADIMCGVVNPSGRTVDIWERDMLSNPVMSNYKEQLYTNTSDICIAGKNNRRFPPGVYFLEYEEGIYYGYRYYETRAYDEGEEWYAENVVYPYGYGLSYTDFTWEITNASPADMSALDPDGSVTVTVDVTNNGDVAAKDVVQLYYSAPYYNGEIEKSHVVLGDFAKTELIPAGETRSVTLSIDVRDMASYDYADANISGDTGWELDASSASSGYSIFLGRNSHDAWAGEDADDLTLTYSSAFHSYDTDVGGEVENRFDDVSGHIETYLSRSDWDFTFPTMPTADDREVTSEFIASLTWTENDEEQPYHTTETFTQGAETELKLYDFIAFESGVVTVDYDDPRWEELISSLSLEEMAALIGQGNYKTNAIESIDLPLTTMPDGPAGFTAFMGDPSVYGTCFYASECVIGATYNKDLAHDMGIMIGIEGIIGNEAGDGRPYSGWYAPAVNIHRSQFGGRNWEYYSEDPYHSGAMAANVIAGAQSKGVACFLKHFALNEQETNRDTNGVLTWANEQAIREIYLKPFEMAVKDAETVAVMSSFNRIGTTWAGGSYELLTEILRNEWGFKGTVITDYNLSDYMLADQMIRAGGDLNLTQDKRPTTSNASSTQIAMMRRAVKNILYTVARSNAMNGHGDGVVWGIGMPTWVVIVIWVDIAIAAALAVWGFFAIRKALKKAKAAERGETPAPGEKQ